MGNGSKRGRNKLGKSTGLAGLPKSFTLDQNYPNPFNPTTTIRYELAEAANVQLAILNIQGQLVRELVNNAQGTGTYHVVWDGKNSFGRQASSGVYFYRLKAGANVSIKKMILSK